MPISRNRKPMVIETMTLNQTVEAMRGLGMRTSETRLAEMLAAGAYPFGICVTCPGGHRAVEIYAKKFWAWVDELGEPVC